MEGSDLSLTRTGTDVSAQQEGEAYGTVMAMLFHAMRHHRDENQAYVALQKACRREGFAAKARYSYPRGGHEIDGLSVGFAREAARVWGNMRYGHHLVSEKNEKQHPPHGQIVIRGYAWDIQTNTMVEKDAVFTYQIFRKKGGWQSPDERDSRELIARHAAIAVRNAILDLLPPDVKEELLDMLRETAASKGTKDLEADMEGTISKLEDAFGRMGVTDAMLCHYLELDELSAMDGQQLGMLRSLYQSIRDGAVQAHQVFPELGGDAAARGDQSSVAADAEAELDEAAAEEEGSEPEDEVVEGEWEHEEPEEPDEDPEPEPEPAKKKAAPKKRSARTAPAEPATPEIRVSEGAWVGELPKVSDLPYVLDNVAEEVVIEMYERDERPKALAHYYKKMEELGYDLEDA